MMLTKDGITVDVPHPSDIARYKKLGYAEPEKAKPAEVKPPEDVMPESTTQEKDQETAEKVLQPAKKGKGKS